jgi:hypothetical protein
MITAVAPTAWQPKLKLAGPEWYKGAGHRYRSPSPIPNAEHNTSEVVLTSLG